MPCEVELLFLRKRLETRIIQPDLAVLIDEDDVRMTGGVAAFYV